VIYVVAALFSLVMYFLFSKDGVGLSALSIGVGIFFAVVLTYFELDYRKWQKEAERARMLRSDLRPH